MEDKLEELKKKIYSREGPKERRQKEFFETQKKIPENIRAHWADQKKIPSEAGGISHEIGSFRPSSPGKETVTQEDAVPLQQSLTKNKQPFYKTKFFVLVLATSFAFMLAAAGLIYYGVFQKGGELELEVVGMAEIGAGDTASWTVLVRNKLGVVVKNTEINFIYPKGAVPVGDEEIVKNLRSKIRIDEIKPEEERKFSFQAKVFGGVGEERFAEVIVLYQPANVSSRLQKQASFVTVISRVPLAIIYGLPEKIVSGQEAKIIVDILSNSEAVFDDLYLRLDWPAGLEFLSSDVKPDYGNTIWKLGSLAKGESRRFAIDSRITGFPEEIKVLVGSIGEYNPQTQQFKSFFEKAAEIRMASLPLYVRQDVNSVENYTARFGETLSFAVYYKNNLPLPVKNVFISAQLSEELLELKSLKVEKGFFDGGTRELVWSAASAPELKELGPGEEGSVTFSVIIKRQPVIAGFSDKNFKISSLAKIGTKNVPEGFEGAKLDFENLLEVRLETQLNASAKSVFYNSPLGPNIGSLPPKVGQETGYTIVFQLANSSNEARGVKLLASLPGNVKWLNQIAGDKKERLSFNPSSGEIVWDAGDVPAGTGFIRPRMFLAFNVALTPGEDAVNNRALLVKDIRVSGQDAFTKDNLEGIISDVTTELKEDLQTTNKDWNVVE